MCHLSCRRSSEKSLEIEHYLSHISHRIHERVRESSEAKQSNLRTPTLLSKSFIAKSWPSHPGEVGVPVVREDE